MKTAVALLAAVLAAVPVAGCGDGRHPGQPASTLSPAAACITDTQQRAGGFAAPAGHGPPVAGVVLGTGSTGVLLANESDGDLCQWQPYATELAGRRYRVLLFNYADENDSPASLRAAAGVLRGRGVHKLFLVGASMGGTGVLQVATELRPPVAGVVDLSGPQRYGGADAIDAVRRLTVPTLFLAGRDDAPFVDDTRTLYGASAATDKKLVIRPNGEHGTALLDDDTYALIQTFLRGH